MQTKLLLSGLFAVALSAVLLAAVAGRIPSPWEGGTAEARTAVLESGAFAPVSGPTLPNAAANPALISFQGRLTNPTNGMPIPDNSYGIAFRVFDAETAGTEVWTETQTVAVTGGLFSVHLGAATPFPAGAFDGTARYLEVQVDTDPAMTPRLLFTSVAYAFHAVAADTATTAQNSDDLNCTGCVGAPEVQFNYAGSNVPGGPATDVTCLDCIAGSEAQFNYAGSNSEGGPANDLACSVLGCVSSLDLGDNQVASVDITDSTITSTDIANDTINSTDVQFNYAASNFEGGAATDVACANFNGCVESADVQFNYAGSASEGGPASDVSCASPTGCISGGEIVDGQVGSTDITDNNVASIDIADNSIAAGDVQFNYAGSTTEGGIANDSQAFDGLDSPAFLRSDVDDSYTGNTLTVGPNSLLKYQNADSVGGLRLSANGMSARNSSTSSTASVKPDSP